MKTLKIAQMVPLVLIAASSFAQGDNRAVPRGGGSSSSSSDSGSRHTGGGSSAGSSSSSGSSSSGRSSASSDGGRSERAVPDAATRRPRPGTGTGDRRYGDRYRGGANSYYYNDPYAYSWGGYYRPYGYNSYGYGYGYGYNDYGFGYGDYYGYYPSYGGSRSYRYRSGNVSQLRTLVEPSKARVYVDGYYAGVVDDFDGLFQRLNVSPGRHDISFRLEGYKSHTFAIYANRDQTLKLRWDMTKGEGETRDTVGEEGPDRNDNDDLDREPVYERDRDRDREPARDTVIERREPSREVDSERRYDPPSRDLQGGQVEFQVEPADASIYIDGEFYGKASQVRNLELPAGRHRLEIVRPGYKTAESEIEVGRETSRVVVRLDRR